jgi:two-component system cell cycle sensor histidine kinase PleC
MAAEDIGKTMEMFSQLDSGFRRRFGGTGVGLPLSRRLVELHGGSLAISSRSGKGTVVTIRLPPERLNPATESL